MPPARSVRHLTQLVVEGSHERDLFEAALPLWGMGSVDVQDIGGYTKLRNGLGELLKRPELGDILGQLPEDERRVAIGIVRDAHESAERTREAICADLTSLGLPVPPEGEQYAEGTYEIAPGLVVRVRIGLLLVPPDQPAGSIEELVAASVAGSKVVPCVEAYMDCLKRLGIDVGAQGGKRRVRAFLSSTADPDYTVGTAARAGVWPLEDAAFDPLREFLAGLTA